MRVHLENPSKSPFYKGRLRIPPSEEGGRGGILSWDHFSNEFRKVSFTMSLPLGRTTQIDKGTLIVNNISSIGKANEAK